MMIMFMMISCSLFIVCVVVTSLTVVTATGKLLN